MIDSDVVHTSVDGSMTIRFQGFNIVAFSDMEDLVTSDEYDANYVRFDANTTVHLEDDTHDILV